MQRNFIWSKNDAELLEFNQCDLAVSPTLIIVISL